jgi:transcription-repair coupling factor (superfamily II helicase)
MTALGLTITPIPRGWAVALTDGRQIARFSGPTAKRRALRYLNLYANAIGRGGG